MGAEGAPSPWAGPISVLRDMGGSAEANEKPSAVQRSDRGASSSDDEALTFSIRRQQASRHKTQDGPGDAGRAAHLTAQRLESQFEAASAMQQAPHPAFSFPAPQPEPSSAVADSSASSAAVLAHASHEDSSQKHGPQSTGRSQQSSLVTHSADLGQHKCKERKESLLFSNPTFESYLDSNSDDELQPISGSPWLARVQHFIQSPLQSSADSSPSHAAQSKLPLARQLMQDPQQPQAAAMLEAPKGSPINTLLAAYPSIPPAHKSVSREAGLAAKIAQEGAAECNSSFSAQQNLSGVASASSTVGNGSSTPAVGAHFVLAPQPLAQQSMPPVSTAAADALAQDSSALSSSTLPAKPQPSHKGNASPVNGSPCKTGARAPVIPTPQLLPAAHHYMPSPSSGAAIATSHDAGAADNKHINKVSVGPPQSFMPGSVMGDIAMQAAPQSAVSASPSLSLQHSLDRAELASLEPSQNSPLTGPPVRFHPGFHPMPANASASGSALLHADATERSPAVHSTPDLPSLEQPLHGASLTTNAFGEVSSTPAPFGGISMQQSPAVPYPSIGRTPAVQTIKGFCNLPGPMQAQQTPPIPHFAPGAVSTPVCIRGAQQHASPAVSIVSSPAMLDNAGVGSLGIMGSTPAADTIKALMAAGGTPAPPQSDPWQASPGLGSVGSTPAADSIKALARGHSSSKSVSILASGCSNAVRSPLDYIAGSHAPITIQEDKSPKTLAGSGAKNVRAPWQWMQVLAMLALVISPVALFTAGHIAASSVSGREHLASGAYGSSTASFGRCLQHMHAPDTLVAATAGRAEYDYHLHQASTAHLSEELACFVTAAAREGQNGLNAIALTASKASLRLHSYSVSMAAHLGGFLSGAVRLCGWPVKAAMTSMDSALQTLCPACVAPVQSAGEVFSQLSSQHKLRLGTPETLSSQLHPVEQLASWAPAKPHAMISQLLSASQVASQAVLRMLPKRITAFPTDAWAHASTWLHVCARWAPSEQPKLTMLHSAIFLAHDGGNIALHSLKQAAGCACSIVEHAGTCLRCVVRSSLAKAAAGWDSASALLQDSSLAAMTDAERDAYLASKVVHDEPSAQALPEQAPTEAKGIVGWLGSLWEGITGPSASAPDGSAADGSAGLSHVQFEDGGTIMWGGQRGESEHPGQPGQSELLVDLQQEDVKMEGSAGLQHIRSGEGGIIAWAGQPDQAPPEPEREHGTGSNDYLIPVEAAGLDAAHAIQEKQVPIQELPKSEPFDDVMPSHVQTQDGGSIEWKGHLTQPQCDHGTGSHDYLSATEAPGLDAAHLSQEAHVGVSQAGEGEPDQEMDADASASEGSCSTRIPCQSQAEAGKDIGLKDADVAAEGWNNRVPWHLMMRGSGSSEESEQAPSGSAASDEASENRLGSDSRTSESGDVADDQAAAPGTVSETSGGQPCVASSSSEDIAKALADAVHTLDGTKRTEESSDEDIAAALADAVHALKEVQQQPDQDSQVQGNHQSAAVAQSHVPAAVLSRLAKLAETVWTVLALIAAVAAALGLAAAAAFLVPASQQPVPKATLQHQDSLDSYGNIFRAAPLAQPGSRILVYRGSPLPRMPTIKFREPLTDNGSTPEPGQDLPAVTPKQAGRRSQARAQSSRFAAETGDESSPAPTPRRSSLRNLRSASQAPASEPKAPSNHSRLRRGTTTPATEAPKSSRRTTRSVAMQ